MSERINIPTQGTAQRIAAALEGLKIQPVSIDSTLSKSGQAADAKATGNKFSQVVNSIETKADAKATSDSISEINNTIIGKNNIIQNTETNATDKIPSSAVTYELAKGLAMAMKHQIEYTFNSNIIEFVVRDDIFPNGSENVDNPNVFTKIMFVTARDWASTEGYAAICYVNTGIGAHSTTGTSGVLVQSSANQIKSIAVDNTTRKIRIELQTQTSYVQAEILN